MKERGERVRLGGWTNIEHCVFVQSLKYVQETETVTISALYHVYNSLAKLVEEITDLGNLTLATKTEQEVGAKYTQHCKEAALINSLISGNTD